MLETIKRTSRVYGKKIRGRGYGTGNGGHTTGSGGKGQTARTGHKSTLFFEGGNVPLFRRLPKYRGAKNQKWIDKKVEIKAINLKDLDTNYNDGDIVSVESLKEKKLIRKNVFSAKILGVGKLTKKLNVEGITASATAKKAIYAVKGTVKK